MVTRKIENLPNELKALSKEASRPNADKEDQGILSNLRPKHIGVGTGARIERQACAPWTYAAALRTQD